MNVLGTSLAGASKKKRSTVQERKPSKFLLLLPCMHACMPVLSCSMPWRASVFGYSHRTCIQFRACLFASLLQFLPSPPVRACCVLRACEPSCWEGRRRSGRCSLSLGVIFFKSLVREPGRILSCPSPILLRCAACKACLHVLLICRIEFDGACATRRRVRRHHGRVACC